MSTALADKAYSLRGARYYETTHENKEGRNINANRGGEKVYA
jgi:hypothetical protein